MTGVPWKTAIPVTIAGIVAKTAVAVDFRKALKKPLDIIHRIGTRIMARQESSFIGQTFIVFAEAFHFCPQMIKLVL